MISGLAITPHANVHRLSSPTRVSKRKPAPDEALKFERHDTVRGMHPRNKYANREPDFAELATRYASLRPYLQAPRSGAGRPWIDWRDAAATRELTRVMLAEDYAITWYSLHTQIGFVAAA